VSQDIAAEWARRSICAPSIATRSPLLALWCSACIVLGVVLATFKTQHDATAWAKSQGHAPLIARVRELNDKKKPDHWRSARMFNPAKVLEPARRRRRIDGGAGNRPMPKPSLEINDINSVGHQPAGRNLVQAFHPHFQWGGTAGKIPS
jgi:hypothetical protein